jgi:hypothetical protein
MSAREPSVPRFLRVGAAPGAAAFWQSIENYGKMNRFFAVLVTIWADFDQC